MMVVDSLRTIKVTLTPIFLKIVQEFLEAIYSEVNGQLIGSLMHIRMIISSLAFYPDRIQTSKPC
jgi:hypothetical protein